MRKNNKKRNERANQGMLDEVFFETVQSQGGITFKEPNYILSGDGYIKVIHIYKIPSRINDFWLEKLMNIDGTIAVVDVSTKDTAEAKINLNKSMKEEVTRQLSTSDFMEIYDAKKRQQELQILYDELESMGEVVKLLHFRIFVPGRNLVMLEDKVDKIMKRLESDQYMPTINLNEGKQEWKSIFQSYTQQHRDPVMMRPHSLTSTQLAGGYPFHYSELIDENGTFIGFTPCGGTVLFDPFAKTLKRKHYNGIALGEMGSGKSTFLKKLFSMQAAEGNFIRCFDVTGEFRPYTDEFGGMTISCDGKDGILNPLEILKAGDDDFTSFARHISKLSTFFKCIDPDIKSDHIIALQNALRDFYDEIGLAPGLDRKITGLPADRYPIFSTFLEYIKKCISDIAAETYTGLMEDIMRKKILSLDKIRETISSIVNNYGQMFDGITTVDNIVDVKVVTFDLFAIKGMGNAFTAQVWNMLCLCWDNCVANGRIMLEKWSNGELTYEEVTKFMMLCDESHKWINADMPLLLDQVTVYAREARKYFAGLWLATHSIRDYVPEGTGQDKLNKLKNVFEFMQYKILFQQDNSAIPLLNQTFGNSLTFTQISRIPTFEVGQAILSISGDLNLELRVKQLQYEKALNAKGGGK